MSRTQTLSHDAFRFNRPVLISARFSTWKALRRQRAQLAQLDSTALEDLGLTRSQALCEARRPFWDVPASWHN